MTEMWLSRQSALAWKVSGLSGQRMVVEWLAGSIPVISANKKIKKHSRI
jgi:hypothetical protein